MSDIIENVLSERYATPEMKAIWSPRGKIIAERRLWIVVLRSEKEHGLKISDQDIADYVRVVERVDLESIARREAVNRHDVKSRIEEFNALAGHEFLHLGMTSRDLTDNIEQMQIRDSLQLVSERTVAVLRRLGARTHEYAALAICARTHNVPAQATTLGKRFAMWAEELMLHLEHLDAIKNQSYTLRSIKGAVGTQQDMISLIGTDGAQALSAAVRAQLGFHRTFVAVGQVYPRSLDALVVSALVLLASAPTNFATTMRLMAGQGQVSEGFKEGQTGSSAMPHKMNARTCERICGLLAVLQGYATMANSLAGHQWYEGDVSCSVVRRVFLPDAFFAIDGLLEATMTVLDEMAVFPAMLQRELMTELPFLSTTALLMEAVKRGGKREEMHAIIKKHATNSLAERRLGGSVGASFIDKLGYDDDFPLNSEEVAELLTPDTGQATEQAQAVCLMVNRLIRRRGSAAAYNPAPIR